MSTKIPAGVALLLATFAAVPAVLPAAAVAAPVVELSVAQARPSPALEQLLLRATCAQACTLRVSELNAVPYRTRGGVEQLPHSAIDPLSISRRLPAGKQVKIRVAVPAGVQRAVSAGTPRGVAFVGNLVTEVTTAGVGEPLEVPRRFTVTGPGTPSPFPPTPYDDAIRLSKEPAGRAAGAPRWSMTVKGVQTSRWSYDRSSSEGGCNVIDRGSGAQTITFSSLRAHTVRQVRWPSGALRLQELGSKSSGVYVPVALRAHRDSTDEKGAQGDCDGSAGGGGGRAGPQQCSRDGAEEILLWINYLGGAGALDASSSILNWRDPSIAPDCPYESARSLRDGIDVLSAYTRWRENIARDDAPGTVIVILRARDVTSVGGGSVTTNVKTTVTFRKVR